MRTTVSASAPCTTTSRTTLSTSSKLVLRTLASPRAFSSSVTSFPSDLSVGTSIDIFSRVFRIIEADEFTRSFYANEGITLAPAESLPTNPFVHTRAMINMK
jgi:hypothetical protein